MRVLLLVVVLLASAAASAFLFPWLKEGHDVEELPLFTGIAAGLGLLALATWKALRARPLMRAAGLVFLSPPLLAYGLLSCDILVDEWRGRALRRGLRITSLRETPIEWPGFDGPVGLRLEIELVHGVRLPGNLYAPKLRMAGSEVPTRRDYFFGPAFGSSRAAVLQLPVYQHAGRWDELPKLEGSPARLSFDLYPSKVQSYEAGRRVCFGKWDAERPLESPPGEDLGACWMFAGRGGVYVDMSGLLTAELRGRSRYQGRREAWQGLLRQLEPAKLSARGFVACGADEPGERCYCAPAAVTPD